jgi:hypothetical protein
MVDMPHRAYGFYVKVSEQDLFAKSALIAKRITEARTRAPELFETHSEEQIRGLLKPTPTDEALRQSLWHEKRNSLKQLREFSISTMLSGHMPSMGFFLKNYLDGPKGDLRLAFILMPTRDPEVLALQLMVESLEWMRGIINEPEYELVEADPEITAPPDEEQAGAEGAVPSPPLPTGATTTQPHPGASTSQSPAAPKPKFVKRPLEDLMARRQLKLKTVDLLQKIMRAPSHQTHQHLHLPQGSAYRHPTPAAAALYGEAAQPVIPAPGAPPVLPEVDPVKAAAILPEKLDALRARLASLDREGAQLRAKAGQRPTVEVSSG